ncbi:TPA: hypothetical protein LSW83_000523 [Serratia marcescens]|nr:hypothetical protein [Serratia marcescens]
MKITGISIFALIVLGVSYQVNAASFDCEKAKSFAEKAICTNPELSKADDVLKRVYDQAKDVAQNKKGFSSLARDLWNAREKCTSNKCIDEWYDMAFVVYDAVIRTNSQREIKNSNTQGSANNHIAVHKYECKDVRDGRLVLVSDYGDRFEIFTKNAERFKSGILALGSNGSKTGMDSSGFESYVVSPGESYIINYASGYSVGAILCKERVD